MLSKYCHEFWLIFSNSSTWLFLGFIIAGIIHSALPIELVKRQLSKKNLSSIFKASLFGIPLPLCSCSVIPVAQTLRKSGASKGATTSFLISTPEIGIDSFLLTQGLLGYPIAIIRLLAAFFSAIISGTLVEKFANDTSGESNDIKSCCIKQNPLLPVVDETKKTSFLKFTFLELPKDLYKPLFWGFILSAILATILPEELIPQYFSSIFHQILLALVISLPLYICASSSTPIAATLVSKGLSPSAAIIFLLLGPATNVSTILATKKMLGAKGLIFYILGITITALCFAFLIEFYFLDYIKNEFFFANNLSANLKHSHDHLQAESQLTIFDYIKNCLSVFMFALLFYPLLKNIFTKK